MLRWSLGQPRGRRGDRGGRDEALDAGYRTKDLLSADGDAAAVTLVGTKEMARVIGDRIAI